MCIECDKQPPYTIIYPITWRYSLFLPDTIRRTFLFRMASPLITCITYSSHCQAKALLTDDYGKDLASVEALIRRHDELERDLTAIENKLEVSVCKCMCVCVCLCMCVCVC